MQVDKGQLLSLGKGLGRIGVGRQIRLVRIFFVFHHIGYDLAVCVERAPRH